MMVGLVYLENEIVNLTDIELLRVFAIQAAVAIQNTQLYELATMDPLTGAFVRRFFNQWILRTLKSALRSHKCVCLVMIDMDNMKAINDGAGHLVGDQALLALTQVLKESTRSSDYIGRFGGDEFTLLLPETPVDGVMLVVNRILQKMSSRMVLCNGESIAIKASLGIAILNEPAIPVGNLPEEYWCDLSKQLQKEADESMYEAKNNGKNKAGPVRIIGWPEP
jgi:diguanylate cyclase (GGDEF)-like protein